MNAIRDAAGITFELDDVERATKPLPTCRTDESLGALFGIRFEACCDMRTGCIANAGFHPLIAAAHLAFSQHRPLVLSPDMIWLTLLQGFARHVNNNAEALRSRFVSHQGKLDIAIVRDDFLPGSPENPWDELVHDFSSAIKSHLRVPYDSFINNFSTTGRPERAACEIALMDAFQAYFSYSAICICGIPSVTLLGTVDDWGRLRSQVEVLDSYGLGWWLPAVREICDHFAMASEGIIDRHHWGNLYKCRQAYGGDLLNGWMSLLVPYVKGPGDDFTTRNPLLSDPSASLLSEDLSSGVSRVPVVLQNPLRGTSTRMVLLGGFVGIEQDPQTLALRPKLGWGVGAAD